MIAISLLSILVIAPQEPVPTPAPSPAGLISKCFSRYAGSKTVSGTIEWTNAALNKKVLTKTKLQVDRLGNRLYIAQDQVGSQAKSWLVNGDGRFFSYDRPANMTIGSLRIVEPVVVDGRPLTVEEQYLALPDSLGDRSAMLDIAVANAAYMKALTGQWATLVYRGKVKVREQEVHAISGNWRKSLRAVVSGRFEIYLSDDGDLMRYVQIENFIDPDTRQPVEVISTWNADLKVNGPLDLSLFRVVR